MLRDHGPKHPGTLLTLYCIATYMDNHGFGFPGQPLIAKGARASVRTVRRHIKAAVGAGWLYVEQQRGDGQGWRRFVYRACVPADLPLGEKDEELVGIVLSQSGDIDEFEPADTMVSPPSRAADGVVSPPSCDAHASQSTCGQTASKVRSSEAEGADTRGTKVRTQLGPTKYSSEVFNGSSQAEGTLARPDDGDKRTADEESETKRFAREDAQHRAVADTADPIAEVKGTKERDAEIKRKVRKMLAEQPEYGADTIVKLVHGATPDLVQRIRAGAVA